MPTIRKETIIEHIVKAHSGVFIGLVGSLRGKKVYNARFRSRSAANNAAAEIRRSLNLSNMDTEITNFPTGTFILLRVKI